MKKVFKSFIFFVLPLVFVGYIYLSHYQVISFSSGPVAEYSTQMCISTAPIQSTHYQTFNENNSPRLFIDDFIFNRTLPFVSDESEIYVICLFNNTSYTKDGKNLDSIELKKGIPDTEKEVIGSIGLSLFDSANMSEELYAKVQTKDCTRTDQAFVKTLSSSFMTYRTPTFEYFPSPGGVFIRRPEILVDNSDTKVTIKIHWFIVLVMVMSTSALWWGFLLLFLQVCKTVGTKRE